MVEGDKKARINVLNESKHDDQWLVYDEGSPTDTKHLESMTVRSEPRAACKSPIKQIKVTKVSKKQKETQKQPII